jgi:hypothetical protein
MTRSITFMNDKIGFAVFGGVGGLCLFLMSGILLSIGTFFAIASVFILLGHVTWMQVPRQEAIPGMER